MSRACLDLLRRSPGRVASALVTAASAASPVARRRRPQRPGDAAARRSCCRITSPAPRPTAAARRDRAGRRPRPLTQARTVLPVMAARSAARTARWVHVRLPGRPSGHTGWILADQTIRSLHRVAHPGHVSARRLTVYRDGRARRHFRRSSASPRRRRRTASSSSRRRSLSPPGRGGPYALAISARSNIFQEFEGGPGQIGIHGTDGLSARSGRRPRTAASGSAPSDHLARESASAPALH